MLKKFFQGFSVKPLYLSGITVAAENDILQHPSTFHTNATNSVTH
jgi:hypothetical protein